MANWQKKSFGAIRSSWHQFINSTIPNFFIEILKYCNIYCFFWIEIIQPFLNPATHSIIKIIIAPNFVELFSWIGENKLVNCCHEQDIGFLFQLLKRRKNRGENWGKQDSLFVWWFDPMSSLLG